MDHDESKTTRAPSTSAGAAIGPRVHAARRALDMPQGELARLIGVDQPRISKIERGHMTQIGPELLRRLARALGVSADHLLATTEDTRAAVGRTSGADRWEIARRITEDARADVGPMGDESTSAEDAIVDVEPWQR